MEKPRIRYRPGVGFFRVVRYMPVMDKSGRHKWTSFLLGPHDTLADLVSAWEAA